MSVERISGKSFHISLDDIQIKVESFSLKIEDGRAVANTNGVPNGYVDGEVSASGDLEVDAQNFKLITKAAQRAGSFKQLKPWDLVAFAQVGGAKQKIEAFDCLFKINDLLSIDSKGGEKSKHKLTFDVTSPDFVRIDGVPYLSAAETQGLH